MSNVGDTPPPNGNRNFCILKGSISDIRVFPFFFFCDRRESKLIYTSDIKLRKETEIKIYIA